MLTNLRRINFRPRVGAQLRHLNSRSVIPEFRNEPILGYRAGSNERQEVQKQIKKFRDSPTEVPIVIAGKEIKTGKTKEIRPPHDHKKVVGVYHLAGDAEIQAAIDASVKARAEWCAMPWEHRAGIFLRMAELLAGPYRQVLNAATILGQSKNYFQAEIDSSCELIDFIRFNVKACEKIFSEQPISSPGVWNRVEYRPLEGFIYAVTPFNFTAIAGNLVSCPVMLGNVCVWKPSHSAILSGHVLMQLYKEAGLPDGVVNFIPGNAEQVTNKVLASRDFSGLHYTGSTSVFNGIYQKIASNLDNYKTYPRIVGETGGKNYIIAHNSCDVDALVVGLVRGAFEYAGQKCSACSRAYIPKSIWPEVKKKLVDTMARVKTGNPEDPSVLVNAVIHETSADKTANYIKIAQEDPSCEVICGGKVDKSVGWFVSPTIVVTTNPNHKLIQEEIFAPVLTVYIYEDNKFEETLELADKAVTYGLTGALFAKDREVIAFADRKLSESAGNFYINDKCTGAVVGQQPFGGARGSGTNDKAGSHLNLLRWVSARSIKETFVPPTEVTYPYMNE